jgi:hypothetical protein
MQYLNGRGVSTGTRHRKGGAGNNHIVGNDSSTLVVDRKDDCHPLSVKRVVGLK